MIARIAAGQHGVVARRQLIAAGVPRHRVDWRVSLGRLRPVHRGVYLVGPVEPPRARDMAAVLACGPAAVLSHGSAAALWALFERGGQHPAPPHVIASEGDHRRAGIRVHKTASLRRDETTRLDGVPITTPARTLLDLAGIVAPRELERALAEALARGLTRELAIRKVVECHPVAPGVGVLRALLDAGDPARTRSEAEERFLALIRQTGLPRPRVNSRVEGLEVDFFWPAEGLVVEIDGHAFHGSLAAVERDRRRDARLIAAGYRVLRFTWQQITEEPFDTIAALAQALVRA